MARKYSELDKWSVFHMALECISYGVVCGVLYCANNEKALINEDNCQEHETCVELHILIIQTRLGRFWNDFFP